MTEDVLAALREELELTEEQGRVVEEAFDLLHRVVVAALRAATEVVVSAAGPRD